MYMLDTNICIYIIKKHPLSVIEKFEEVGEDEICISVVTYAELQYGVERSSSKKMNQAILDDFIFQLEVLPWDEYAVKHYAKIRRYLEEKGTPIGYMDMMIAAHALSQKCVLITNNLKEFARVPHLKVENWL